LRVLPGSAAGSDRLAAGALAVALALTCSPSLGQQKSDRSPGPPSPPRSGKAGVPDKPPAAASAARQRALQEEQRELKVELAKLKRQLAASESSRAEAADALADLEATISATRRRLRELAATRQRVEQQLAALEARERDAAQRQGLQEGQLAALLRQQQALSLTDPLHRLFEGKDPGQPSRDGEYLAYLSRSAQAAVEQLQDRRIELQDLKDQSEQKRSDLLKITEDERKNQQLLEQENARRRRAMDQLSKQIASQRQSISRMERDDKRLGLLIDQLSKVVAEQARRNAERARTDLGRVAPADRSSAAPPSRPAPSTAGFSPPSVGNFSQRRGKLELPVQGTVAARFGTARRGDGGAGGPTWKGLFIRAPAGAEVRSVGDGRVVFSDWLRGFGNLLVIDHGDGFLSVYGNNEALLRNPGDPVAVGDVVALVGNTGGNEHPGLYFELRFQGRPFDPLSWVAAR